LARADFALRPGMSRDRGGIPYSEPTRSRLCRKVSSGYSEVDWGRYPMRERCPRPNEVGATPKTWTSPRSGASVPRM